MSGFLFYVQPRRFAHGLHKSVFWFCLFFFSALTATGQTELSIWQRLNAPTPKFFRRIRNIGLVLGAVGAALLAQPVELPGFLSTLATYLVMAGTVASAISQAAVENAKLGE